ncbi:MAG TPA: biopolymer transporter ExbD [Polyangiaceae bacterium]|jgi:biopolymer transport protein ExbD|nr:biopolymer transporter ExbD [Polyangiaceae bacterium]
MTEAATPKVGVVKSGAPKAKYKSELRKAIRRGAHEPEVNFLNITAMLDIMTIILVFLLKTLGESSTAIPQSDDLRIPRSLLDTEPSQEGVRVTVSKTQLMVGDEAVVKLPSRQSLIQTGVSAKDKRGGPNDLYIVPLGNALSEARRTDKLVRQVKGLDPSMSEAVIIADETTPWRLLIEVLFTLGQNEFGRFHLMVMQSKSAR